MTLLHLTEITHDYGAFRALTDVHLTLQPGAIGLIGQNGAGKSTLLKILMGLMRPSQGAGTVLGYDLLRQAQELRFRVGFMPEAESLIPGIRGVDLVSLAGELSGMPRQQARRRAHEVLSYLELEEARYRLCEQYSVGMKQRLKLACALVHDPQLLLLDEPTAGLDPDGRDAMLQLLQAIAQRHGKSLILSTHLLGDIERVCEQVVIVDKGRVRGVGTIDQLCQSTPGRYRLRWTGDAAAFRSALTAAGVTFAAPLRSDQAVVDVPAAWSPQQFFEHALQTQITLRSVVPEEEDLEQVYHRLITPAASKV
jgi:ABC-2 type transport system ATP-binding protein